jgi:hypothetical protein
MISDFDLVILKEMEVELMELSDDNFQRQRWLGESVFSWTDFVVSFLEDTFNQGNIEKCKKYFSNDLFLGIISLIESLSEYSKYNMDDSLVEEIFRDKKFIMLRQSASVILEKFRTEVGNWSKEIK